MPKGFAGAKKAAPSGGGQGFHKWPKGVRSFSLKDGESAKVRFLQGHDDIEWARKWKLPPSGGFPFGELVNCVDQNEDGTPDPGYAAGYKSGFKAYPTLILRNAPQFQRKPDGSLVKDGNDNKVLTGYADDVCVWACSFAVYEILEELDGKYRGLMSMDWEIKRKGASTDTKYSITPADPYNLDQPMSDADRQLAHNKRIDVAQHFTKAPTYEELNAYFSGGATPEATPSFQQQAASNSTGLEGPNPFLS